ncbi:cytochrome bd oxidase small subunit CydS [Solibacillus cecembensis]
MSEFLIFVAPFIVVILALFIAFYTAPKDKLSNKQ